MVDVRQADDESPPGRYGVTRGGDEVPIPLFFQRFMYSFEI
jgi:hypothetical protein